MSDRSAEKSDEEQFEDAVEQKINSPVPITRVERTDDQLSHGEVPGTEAHAMRIQDAQPDEMEIIPESSSASDASRPPSSPVPKTIVEKVDPSSPSHGEVPGTEAHAMRQADAQPDEVKKAPDMSQSGSPAPADDRDEASGDEDGAADDFDDFNEGEEGDGDDDFGAFDEGDDTQVEPAESAAPQQPDLDFTHLPELLDYDELDDSDDIAAALEPYIPHLFPNLPTDESESLGPPRSSFLTERSQSLWAQLVAPPPLQPPNWVKSRTRRLFLVSLGVPVDLDEILPASKQKKLVLPSMEAEQVGANGAASKLKQKNASSTSLNSSSSKPERRRRGQPAPPQFDNNAARLLVSTTREKLEHFNEEELRHHNAQLEELKKEASAALEYWLIQRDNASGEKEAFEEVINNFVKHAKKIRT